MPSSLLVTESTTNTAGWGTALKCALPTRLSSAACLACERGERLASTLYTGTAESSLYHKTNDTESSGKGEVTSHGSVSRPPDTACTGTGISVKKNINDVCIDVFLSKNMHIYNFNAISTLWIKIFYQIYSQNNFFKIIL